MLPGLETLACQGLAVPQEVMHHVVRIESSFNPYAIGVVGGRLARQPRTLPEALSTVRMLEQKGYNFSIGLAQVNRYNLDKYGLQSYEKAFEPCANLVAGSRILAECYTRSGGDWGKSFSCYYSGNFSTGFRHGYVQKIYASIRQGREVDEESPNAPAIAVVGKESRKVMPVSRHPLYREGDQGRAQQDAQAFGPPVVGAFSPLEPETAERESAERRPSRVEPVASRRIAVDAVALNSDPAYVASQPQPAQTESPQAQAALQQAPLQQAVPQSAPLQPVSPRQASTQTASAGAPAAVQPSAIAQRPRGPVVLQPYSSRSAPAPEPKPAPRVSVPPVDRTPRKADEAFVF